MRAVLRRTQGLLRQPELIRAGDVTLDLRRRRARTSDRLLDLTSMEFDLLVVLARRPGQVFSRMQLLDRVHGEAFQGYERTIDVHVKNLRKKLGDDPRQPRYIETVHGVGYRFLEKTADA